MVDVFTEAMLGDEGSAMGQLDITVGGTPVESIMDVILSEQHDKTSFDIAVPVVRLRLINVYPGHGLLLT